VGSCLLSINNVEADVETCGVGGECRTCYLCESEEEEELEGEVEFSVCDHDHAGFVVGC